MEDLARSVTLLEQRAFIKISLISGKSATDIHKILKDYMKNNAYSKRQVERWIEDFKNGRYSTEDENRPGRPLCEDFNERVIQIRNLLNDSRAWTLSLMSCQLQFSRTSIYRILTEEIGVSKKCGKWVPHLLSEDQMATRVAVSRLNKERLSRNPGVINRTLAIDETWVSLGAAPNKDQARYWLAPGEELPEIVSDNIHGCKRMLILALDWMGVAFYELLDEKETVTGERYKKFLENKIPDWLTKTRFKTPILLDDNARPHRSKVVKDYLISKEIRRWEHPPYSPDLHPCDFQCFNQLKRSLKSKTYDNWFEFEERLKTLIDNGTQNGLYRGVRMISDRWNRVIESEGKYI